jgi:glutathione synthase/RimK-type ligase-like ATP-grasp enzyme
MSARLAILYEHPEWFRPLFAALRDHGIGYEEWPADRLLLDPARARYPDLVLNRMSASAAWRGHGCAQFAVAGLLALLEDRGVEVVNGAAAYAVEISKLRQASVFRRAGVRAPATLAVNRRDELPEAARALGYPLFVKPNCGGAGHGVSRFDAEAELLAALPALDPGIDGIFLLQAAAPAGDLLRIEVLGGEVLYAVRIDRPADHFALCPADACAADGVRFTPVTLPVTLEREALAIARAARLDVGGVECFLDPRSGEAVFYDINALSNFVANARDLLGFCPTARFAGYLARRLAAVPLLRF